MKKGFTLIELLVVVAIIALLVSVIIANVRIAKEKSRDARRANDIRTIQNSLAGYQINQAQYPIYNGYITGNDVMSLALIGEAVINVVPIDPLNQIIGSLDYRYSYQSLSNGADYLIRFCLETNIIQGMNQGCNNEVRP